MRWRFVLLVMMVVRPAIAGPDGELCDKVWPKRERATSNQTQACATYWLHEHAGGQLMFNNIGVGEAFVDDALWRDFVSEDFARMLHHVEALCAIGPCDEMGEGSELAQARDYFKVLVDAHQSFDDPRNAGLSFKPVLDKMLQGERITRAELAFWSPMVLGRLRLRRTPAKAALSRQPTSTSSSTTPSA